MSCGTSLRETPAPRRHFSSSCRSSASRCFNASQDPLDRLYASEAQATCRPWQRAVISTISTLILPGPYAIPRQVRTQACGCLHAHSATRWAAQLQSGNVNVELDDLTELFLLLRGEAGPGCFCLPVSEAFGSLSRSEEPSGKAAYKTERVQRDCAVWQRMARQRLLLKNEIRLSVLWQLYRTFLSESDIFIQYIQRSGRAC